MNKVKVITSLLFIITVMVSLAAQSVAYPPFLERARKFGAKDCRFCHVKAEGNAPFNPRGQWLIKEKDRRNADAVDPEWLVDYKAKPAPKKKK